MRRFALAAVALAAAAALASLPHAVAAQEAAVVRGRVFECRTGAPLAGAIVRLTADGAATELRTDAGGRFVRVGVPPGEVALVAVAPTSWDARTETVRRYGTLDASERLDVALGMLQFGSAGAPCQPARIPQAMSPVLRYTLH